MTRKYKSQSPGLQDTAWRLGDRGAAGAAGKGGAAPGAPGPPRPRGSHTGRWRKGAGVWPPVCFSEWTIKFRKFEKGEKKKPRPFGRPLLDAWGPRRVRVVLRLLRRGARAGMGVTVDVHQVYKYPFEQVVASFLRKVPAGSSPAGLASSRAVSAGPAVCAPCPALLPAFLSSLSFLPSLLPVHKSALTTSFLQLPVRLRDVLDEGGGGFPRRLPLRREAKAPCGASRSHSAPAQGRGLWRSHGEPKCWGLVDLSSTSVTPEKLGGPCKPSSWFILHYLSNASPAFSFIKQL